MTMLSLWVDADGCPRMARDIIIRTAQRMKIMTRFVANSPLRLPQSPWLTMEVVQAGFDRADDVIVDSCLPGDLVITADIPLASRIVDVGATAIDPRGDLYTVENVKSRLATRNLLADLRDLDAAGGYVPPYRAKDKSKFASTLDAWLRKHSG